MCSNLDEYTFGLPWEVLKLKDESTNVGRLNIFLLEIKENRNKTVMNNKIN